MMTAMNVQSLMEEAEDASSYLQISAPSCNLKAYFLQYLANLFQCAFGRQSYRWLSELRLIYDRCRRMRANTMFKDSVTLCHEILLMSRPRENNV